MPIVTPQQWEQISALYTEVVALPAEQREAYLAEIGADDLILQELRSLLAQPQRLMGIDPTVTGRTLHQYRIIEQIGHGAMGQVYKAHDMSLNRLVALKLVPSDVRNDPTFRERLRREAKAASQLNHPNIVVVHEIGYHEKEDLDFIVMEFVKGETLSAIVARGALPLDLAHSYALQMASALHFAHDSGVLHGDLKPANVMVDERHHVKLLDFGLSRELTTDTRDPRRSDMFGTIQFMAPERLGSRLTDPRSEIFSFGLILYQMLAGEHPFPGETVPELSAAMNRGVCAPLPSHVPQWFARIIHSCLEKNVDERFQSMQQVLAALRGDLEPAAAASPKTAHESAAAAVNRVHRITAHLDYKSIGKSRRALSELLELLVSGISDPAREAATTALTDFLTAPAPDQSDPIRSLRRQTLETLRKTASLPLGQYFKGNVLEDLDLYGMDFSSAPLADVSFARSFSAAATFQQSDLKRTCFAGASIRNVNFIDADLSDGNFTDADWFNAIGLTEDQLSRVRVETLEDCPDDVAAMHDYLASRYYYPFHRFHTHIQQQLLSTWADYLRRGGLRDAVTSWKRSR